MIEMLKRKKISKINLTSIGNSIATGYSIIDTIKPLLKRNESLAKELEKDGINFNCYSFARPVFEWVTSTKDPAIVDSAVMYAKISILFFYVLGPLFVFRCSLQGMGRKIVPLISSITEMLVKILSAMFLVPAFAYKGVAFTEPISWVLMTIILATAYMTGNPEKYVKSDEIVE